MTVVATGRQTQTMATEMTDEDTIRQVVERLQLKYPNFSRTNIEDAARSEFDVFSGRPVRAYVSILTERATLRQLTATGIATSTATATA